MKELRWWIILIFIVTISVNLVYFQNIQRLKFVSELRRSSQVIDVFLDGFMRSISTGYFQWDDFYNAFVLSDEEFIRENLSYVEEDFPYVKRAEVVKRPKDIASEGLYYMRAIDNNIIIYFNVWDSKVKRVIEDWLVKVEIDLPKLIQSLGIDKYFVPDLRGDVKISEVKFKSLIPFLKPSQILFSFSFSILIALIFMLMVASHSERLTKIKLLEKISFIMEEKDPYTRDHSKNVAFISLYLADRLGLSRKEKELLEEASLLHDIGKIGISDEILNKRGKLSPEEFEVVKKHPEIAFSILSDIKGAEVIAKVVRHHHERVDGNGYPDGLKGEEIPLLSRIIAVADIFDALISERPYRSALSPEEAIKIMGEMPIDKSVFKVLKENYKEMLSLLRGVRR
ncbi:MAG: HD-GYP domain-containing protein [Synergistetes bacterium]|nr:HD-GYP domain-containing protein [Synergistota bacterium]